MKKSHWIWIVSVVVIIALIIGAVFIAKAKIGSVTIPKTETPPIDSLTSQLTVPAGFAIRVFAKDIPGARVIEIDPKGRLVVSQTNEGKISVIEDTDYDGIADTNKIIAEGLNNPHGMTWKCDENGFCKLYVAESNKLTVYGYDAEKVELFDKKELLDLSSSATDRHKTRTLLFLGSPYENTLLISVGSSCNVCNDTGMRGKIMAYDIKTNKVEEYATGLRNAVFMTLNPVNGFVFMTEMGRDGLGDNIPPDEINVIDPNKTSSLNFGWPICYGKNIHDTQFDKNTYIRNPCMEPFETSSWFDLGAHVAPLGLAFIPEEGWPEDMWFDLLVVQHGSWNRSIPVGYNVVKINVDAKGNPVKSENFITGWLTKDGKKIGRPADIKILSGGVAYISDDMNGIIYKLSRITK